MPLRIALLSSEPWEKLLSWYLWLGIGAWADGQLKSSSQPSVLVIMDGKVVPETQEKLNLFKRKFWLLLLLCI